ncbi:hypothetical protein [Empedobacter sp.]|uniref:hypothetical protein n=1 Tax=Empedobacter sp. TaxID=1927715 RepID=UPI0028990539|nr:hypothetical protein [Empedobacter sp.]
MAKDTQKAVPLTEEQLIEKEAALKLLDEALAEDAKTFVLDKEKFENEKSNFEKEKEAFETEKSQFKADIDFFQKRKADLDARENALEQKSEVKSDKKVDPVAFEFEGEKYQFTASAPQHILLNGKGVSQKEIAKDDELKLQLIGGNSSLIVKK